MANLDDLTLEDYYDESENFSGKIPQGVFPAHIMDMNVKEDIPIKSRTETGIQHLCDIYEFTYQIAPEAASEEYKVNDTEVVKGQAFVGKTVKGKGVFKFKSVPADKKGFKNNSGGNKGFKTFLDSVKVEFNSFTKCLCLSSSSSCPHVGHLASLANSKSFTVFSTCVCALVKESS